MEGEPKAAETSEDESEVQSIGSVCHDTSGLSEGEPSDVGCESCEEAADNSMDHHKGFGRTEGDDEAASDEDSYETDQDSEQCVRCSLCSVDIDCGVEHLQAATDEEEVLVCDGECGRSLPPTELRFLCPSGCDFDICTACAAVSRHAAVVAAAAARAAAEEER